MLHWGTSTQQSAYNYFGIMRKAKIGVTDNLRKLNPYNVEKKSAHLFHCQVSNPPRNSFPEVTISQALKLFQRGNNIPKMRKRR